MRAIQERQSGYHRYGGQFSHVKSLVNKISQFSETLWLCITFALFVIMGPFSVIAVVYGLWALANGEHKEKMIEPASC